MLLIKNSRVMDPATGRDEITDILLDKERIVRIGTVNENEVSDVIDGTGMVTAPGLIDVHVHFRDPGFTYKEDLFTGAAAAAHGGFTTVVCMANTKPVVDNAEILQSILEKGKHTGIHILQAAALTKGMKGIELVDMESLAAAGAIGFTDDGLPLMNTGLIAEAMDRAAALGLPISFHEEDPNLIGKPGINEGVVSKKLGVPGASHLAEDTMVARDSMLAVGKKTNVNIQHISSGVSVEVVRLAQSLGAKVWAEATPHHFTLTEEDVLKYGSNAKMNPPLRTIADQEKIIEGMRDNTISIIATDHAPHSKEEKEKGLLEAPSGIIGLETSLALGITYLVRREKLTLMQLLEKMTVNPARLYHLETGCLNEGGLADLVLFHPDKQWKVEDLASKSENTPFLGKTLYGKVEYTICKGKIVYQNVEKE